MNTYRIREFVNPADQRSLVVDTSAGMVLGARPGLERFGAATKPILPHVDGIVTSPGQARYLNQRTRQDAALLIRTDWMNSLRGEDFVLPPETTYSIALVDVTDVLDLGASAIVMHMPLGYPETIEADSVKRMVSFALAGAEKGLPLIVDVLATGSRIVLLNKAIELGVSLALEGGASGIVIPWPGSESFQTIMKMVDDVPVWIKPEQPDPNNPLIQEALDLGAVGIWLGDDLFAEADPVTTAMKFQAEVHVS